MSKRLYVGLTIILLFSGGAFLWWETVSTGSSLPAHQSVEGLADSTTITWTTENTAAIHAPNTPDALTALGYVHGITRSWVMTVWRRTALGTLSTWFGHKLIPLDRHARRLGFAHHAKRAFERLPTRVQNRLQAYTRGVNAALQSEHVRHQEAFLAFNKGPRRWEPWHPLAIERLLAWISTGFPEATSDRKGKLEAFRETDRLFRRWLHLHGWNRSVVWAARSARDSTRTALFTRHVLGASADPLIQEIVLHRPDRSTTILATFPGALLFPTGTTEKRGWSYLLSSTSEIDHLQVDSTRIQDRYERIRPASGEERLVHVREYDDALLLSRTSPDSARVLRWTGLRGQSDVPRWITEANLRTSPDRSLNEAPAFHLFNGAGLVIDSTGDWTVHGRPPVLERAEGSILLGRSIWARYQAESLQEHRATGPLAPDHWSVSDSSTWAATLLPRLLPNRKGLSQPDSLLRNARSYLQNWNYMYKPSSIGAVLFEQWMRAYRRSVGHLPLRTEEPAYFNAVRQRRAFVQAVSTLTARYGPDVRQWRWEKIARTRRHFLGWSPDSLVSADLESLRSTQFAPLERPGRGHISALAGGPTLSAPTATGPAPTQWKGWTLNGQTTLTVRRLRFDPSGLFARSLLRDERPAPISVSSAQSRATTILVPADR